MKKLMTYLLIFTALLLWGCGNREVQETEAVVTEIISEPGKIRFIFDSDWTVSREGVQEDTLSRKLEEDELIAVNAINGSSISLVYEDLTEIQGGTLVRMEDYVEAYWEKLKTDSSYSYNCTEPEMAQLYGEEYYTFAAEVSELEANQQFYLRRIGDRVMILTFTAYGEERAENLMEYGSSL